MYPTADWWYCVPVFNNLLLLSLQGLNPSPPEAEGSPNHSSDLP